jgi:hypothetical protein
MCKGLVKNKNAKLPSPKGVHTSSVRNSKDGKDKEATAAATSVSNGTSTLDSHLRQPIKNKAVIDKQTRLSKHPGKSDAASSEAPTEKTRPRLVKKEPLDNIPGKAESSSYPFFFLCSSFCSSFLVVEIGSKGRFLYP